MRKLVLGIALVVVLDVAFIWMMQFDAVGPELAQTMIPSPAEQMVRQKPSFELLTAEEKPQTEGTETELGQVGSSSSKSIYKPAPARSRNATPVKIDAPALDFKSRFPDTIIYVPRHEPPDTKDPSAKLLPNEDAPVTGAKPTAPPPKKKRSFESKAFGVIKKPFNVIKKPFKWIGSAVRKIGN
ncbi:MAG: hypothetical protein DWQ47_06355 [Acidobacteria bacterium]|nr:MAG: hypothetical protein DWQ32_09905 [Acidobacteriota bacterium]REK01995.1 MAG: hypothetical protein DWQ38_06335 [Acidobacteriota bacterium]REK14953.1 MAG: hypothetical protein DWQ43_15595 [Acidobacteriota bacterium]REK45667.1 MAG: hypothetical protein DWQ47_06355 [Acidobacteriota bacterium]